ncbi:MAG TPA: hypothetical protein VJO34_02695 [Methylomirabilota bacterium]|nr:hypothetical protein [Methylomirabilota bacterium]
MGLNATAIVTLDQLRDYLGKSPSDIGGDNILEAAVNGVSDVIESITRRAFVLRTIENELYNGSGTAHLELRSAPVISLKTPALSELQYRGSPTDAWQDVETNLAYIMIDPDLPYRISLWREHFPRGTQNIKVSYKAGYASVPAEVQLVCLEAAAIKVKESGKGDGRLGRTSISNTTGGVSSTDSFSDLQDRHRAILSRYRWVMP